MRENKNKKSQIKKVVNSITVNMLVYSLIASHSPAFAQQQKEEGHWVDGVLGLTKMVTGEMSKYQQGAAAAQAQAALMQTYRPQAMPAKNFPQCQIGQARTAFPQNMCNRPLQDPNEHSQAQGMVQVATQMSQFYDNLLIGGQNTPMTVGIQCLEEQQKAMQTSINDRINNLQKISDNIVFAQKQFEMQNEQLMKEMEKASRELNGGNSNDINAKVDFSSFFPSNQCQNIIGKENIQSAGVNGGLNGILQVATAKVGTATDYNDNNRKAHVDDVNNQIAKMQSTIANDGIDAWASGPGGQPNAGVSGSTAFKAYQNIVSEKIYGLTSQRKKVEKELQSLDPSYTLPPMDDKFVADFATFSSGAESFYKKKYVNDCVTKADSGVGLDNDQILSSLTDGRGNNSSAFKKYHASVQAILEDDNLYLEDKMQRIKDLEAIYGQKMTIGYTDAQGINQKKTTYDYLGVTISACEQRFEYDNDFKPGGSKAVSQQKQIERAKSYMKELEDEARNFASDLSAELKNKIIHCDGISKKSNQCAESPFDASSDNFCIAHADSCVSEIQNCYNVANKKVEEKKTILNKTAAEYNKRSAALIKQQQVQLAQLSSQVQNDAEFLKKYFPGANYKYPEGLIIPPVKPTMSEFGVDLIGGGSLDYLAALPTQINKLKGQLAEQATTVNQSIDKYIADQKRNMEVNRDKWAALSQSCDDKQFTYRQQIAKQNAEAQQKYGEAKNEALQVCTQYSQLAQQGPMAGCEGDYSASELYGEAIKASAFLNPQVMANMNAYRSVCAKSNSEKESSDDDEYEMSALPQACQDKGWSGIKNDLKKSVISELPQENLAQKEAIEKYLEKKNASLPKELEGKKIGILLKRVHKTLFPEVIGSFDKEEILKDVRSTASINSGDSDAKEQEEDKQEASEVLKAYANSYIKSPKESKGQNLCTLQKNQATLKAIDDCKKSKNGTKAKSCFKEKYADTKKGLDDSEDSLMIANNVIESLISKTNDDQWSKIGERQNLGPCMAQSANTRSNPNVSALTSSIESFFGGDTSSQK